MKIHSNIKLRTSIIMMLIFLVTTTIIGIFKIVPKSKAEIVAATAFAGGTGTSADPYQISNAAELLYLAKQVNTKADLYSGKYLELTANIDLNEIPNWSPIGCLASTNGYRNASGTGFMGTFNGNNYTISNVNISVSTANLKNTCYAIGLFGAIHGGTVKNLKLNNVNIEIAAGFPSTLANDMSIGALIGKTVHNSRVYNIEVNNFTFNDYSRISNLNEKFYSVGGITGDIVTNVTSGANSVANKLDNCIVRNASITTGADATNTTKAKQHFVGGITGRVRYQSIYPTNCVFSGTIIGNAYVSPTIAGAIIPASANHSDFNTISGVSIQDSSITNLLYYNTTVTQGNGSLPNQAYNKRENAEGEYNPLGTEISSTFFKSYVDDLNTISQANANFYGWKSVNGKIVLDYGQTSASIYITEITETTATLVGVINSYAGQDMVYEWKDSENNVVGSNNEVVINLKSHVETITLKISTASGDFTDSVEIPRGNLIRAQIEGTRTGINYSLESSLVGASETGNYTFQWKENDVIITGANASTYTAKAGATAKDIKVIITDLSNNIEYEETYSIPALTLSLTSENTQQLQTKVNAVFKIEEDVIDGITEEITYSWNVSGNTVTTTVPNIYVDLKMQTQQVSLSISGSNLNLQAMNTVEIAPIDLNIIFSKNATNKTITATLGGADISKMDTTKFSYQWYFIADNQENLINGATSNQLSNALIDSTYKLIATYQENNEIIIEGQIAMSKNVVFVDYNNGIETNSGVTSQVPVKTLNKAYEILAGINGNQITKEEDNIIVIMGNYSDTTNHFGNLTDLVFTVPATITGKHDSIDYSGVLYFFGGDNNASEVKNLQANTKFEYLKFRGNSTASGYAYLYAQGYNLTMGKGISMINYSADTTDSHGLSATTTCTNFHVLGGHFNYNETTIDKGTDEPCIITIESGSYARIIAGGRNTITNEVSKNVYATRENPFNVIINISYEGVEHATPNAIGSSGRRFVDIGLVCGGQTDGAGYFNTTINYNNGIVGRFVGGSLGNKREIVINNIRYDTNYFVGDLELNINGGYIHEFYGGSLGRYTGQITHNGHININITGGTISNNVFSTGASAITGEENNEANIIFTMTDGTINGNVYGGAYGYSANIDTDQASINSGILYGNISIEISGGTVNGNIYGGGKGTDAYASNSTKQALAKVIGNINITIEDQAKINGSVYGAGEGYTQYRDMAEVIGDIQIHIQNQYDLTANANSNIISNNVHGAGNASRLVGNSTINLGNIRIAGNVYGGGQTADITGNVLIIINRGTQILSSVYGGGENGVVGDSDNPTTVEIHINGNASITGDLYGGGENALTNSSITMYINKLTILGDIYGGGKLGLVDENITVNIDQIDITGNIFGGGESADVTGNIDMSVIAGTISGDIYGGGNLGQVQGNTNLLIGDINSDETITIQGVTYAGGKGADSTTITVTGNSQATIAGMNTNIVTYGSTELGAVQGDVDITFNNYRNRTSNNRYKNMTGINKATNLEMINSYVYLTGGMQNITNVHLPQGSGLLISEDSRIEGNFSGGGILYLKSEVCFTINGDIEANSSTTTLTLNPEKLVNTYIIKGNINYPYVVVEGTDYLQNTTEKAFTSGYPTKYSILNAINSNQNSIYYIERDVEINTYIGVVSVLQEEKDYSELSAITEENSVNYGNINIIERESFTVKGTIQYTHVGTISDVLNGTKFKNITRQISLQENYANVTIPSGTRITLIDVDGIYGYYVSQDITTLPVSEFKNIETKANISEMNDITNRVTAYQDNTVRYEEDFKVIFDFSDCEDGMTPGVYSFELTITDEETENFNSSNTVEIENNNYDFNYQFDKETYFAKNNVRLNGNFTMEEENYTVRNSILTTDIYAVITFENNQNQKIQIPKGTILKVDDIETSTNGYYSMFEVIEDINHTRNRAFALDIDMQNCLTTLSEGTYYISFDFYLTNGNNLKSFKIYSQKCNFNIINGENYGIEAQITNINENDKKQLINEANETRTIKVDIEKGNLIGANVKVLLQERTAPFVYVDITNTVSQTVIDEITTTKDITATFGNELDNGMYRLVFELYDNNDYKYCEDVINVLVQR